MVASHGAMPAIVAGDSIVTSRLLLPLRFRLPTTVVIVYQVAADESYTLFQIKLLLYVQSNL